jgi:hypothetical protein
MIQMELNQKPSKRLGNYENFYELKEIEIKETHIWLIRKILKEEDK